MSDISYASPHTVLAPYVFGVLVQLVHPNLHFDNQFYRDSNSFMKQHQTIHVNEYIFHLLAQGFPIATEV